MRSIYEAKRRERVSAPTDTQALTGRRVEFWRKQLVRAVLLYSDTVLALVVWWIAALVRDFLVGGPVSESTFAVILPGMLGWLALRHAMGLYPGYGLSQVDELRRQVYSVLAAASVSTMFAFFLQMGDLVSRLVLLLGFAGLLILSPLVRHITKLMLKKHRLWGKPVVIIGSAKGGEGFVQLLDEEWGFGLRPAVFFENSEECPEERELSEAMRISQRHGIDTIMLVISQEPQERMRRLGRLASYSFRHVIIMPDFEGTINSAVAVRDFSGIFGVEIKHNLLDPWSRRAKRTLDLGLTTFGALVLVPLLLALCALVKLDSSGPIFYAHRRIGAAGKEFRCWKFRTMHANAEVLLESHLGKDPHLRAEWELNHKLRDDPRVTRVGRFLRKTSLDELPQLWNVLAGQMSLVGPRPIVKAEVVKYGDDYDLYRRVMPGISGMWQVSGRNNTSYEERVTLDSYYVRNWSVWLDLIILARTIESVILRRGAY